jgi:hypothetical protein
LSAPGAWTIININQCRKSIEMTSGLPVFFGDGGSSQWKLQSNILSTTVKIHATKQIEKSLGIKFIFNFLVYNMIAKKSYCSKFNVLYSKLPPVGHAFSRALRNPGAWPNNSICVFPVRFFFFSQRIYCCFSTEKKVFSFFVFQLRFFVFKGFAYFFHGKKVFSFFSFQF